MPTREEMIQAIKASRAERPPVKIPAPSREDMITAIREHRESQQATPQDEGAKMAGLQGFGQGGTFGYLPQLQARVAKGLDYVLPESLGGQSGDSYDDLRRQFQLRDQALREQHPIASAASNIGGAVTSIPLGGLAIKGAMKAPAVARAVETVASLPWVQRLNLLTGGAKVAEAAAPAIEGMTGAFKALPASSANLPAVRNLPTVFEAAEQTAGAAPKLLPGAGQEAILMGGELAQAEAAAQAANAIPAIGTAAKASRTLTNVGRGAKAALTSAAYGAAYNPEVEDTPEDPNAELKARLRNAGIAGAFGAAGETLIGGIGAGLERRGRKLSEKAVIKQMGANAGQIKKIVQKEELPKLEKFMGKEKLMRPGNNIETVAEKTAQILEQDGPKIGQIYQDAQKAIRDVHIKSGASGEIPMYLDPATKAYKPVGSVNGNVLADKIVASVKASSRTHPDRNLVNKTIEEAVAPLRDMGEGASLVDLHSFRQGLDENINWGMQSKERDAVQRAYIAARNLVADEAKGAINVMDQYLGGNKLGELKRLNERYSAASTVNKISTQAVGREMAKAFMGHGVIGGGTGMGAGYLEYKRSHDPLKAAAVGLTAATAVTTARKYGAPIGYYGGKTLQSLGRGVNAATPRPQTTGVGAASPWLYMSQKEKKNER